MILQIKRLTPTAKLPIRAHNTDAGYDWFADEDLFIPPQERVCVSTGIAMAIPQGYAGLFWDRSSMAVKFGITTLAGVIDAGYRGEVKIALYNTTQEPFKIEKGMKIAQMLIKKVESFTVTEVESLDDTNRGAGGFGSTGTH
ncbi:TPA: dUTP diphosphatase [Candidatus Woesearchaeota archaeon]|nr:dUTP diphosphatase [archaeon]HIJ11482.1 dUTP diphosphatase [Candidatus Woesearchaeota archaeon]